MASTRDMDDRFAPIIDWLMEQLRGVDSRFVITSGYRSPTAQAALFARFQAGEPGLYTVLPPGRSQHERGLAADIARMGIRAQEDPLLRELGAWWRSVGGVWGGERDPVHFEAPKSWTGRS